MTSDVKYCPQTSYSQVVDFKELNRLTHWFSRRPRGWGQNISSVTNKAAEYGSHEKKYGGENFSNRSLPEREGGFRASADVSVQKTDANVGATGGQRRAA
jgi:hypothetical protein